MLSNFTGCIGSGVPVRRMISCAGLPLGGFCFKKSKVSLLIGKLPFCILFARSLMRAFTFPLCMELAWYLKRDMRETVWYFWASCDDELCFQRFLLHGRGFMKQFTRATLFHKSNLLSKAFKWSSAFDDFDSFRCSKFVIIISVLNAVYLITFFLTQSLSRRVISVMYFLLVFPVGSRIRFLLQNTTFSYTSSTFFVNIAPSKLPHSNVGLIYVVHNMRFIVPNYLWSSLNPIQDGLVRGCSRMGGVKRPTP